MDWQCCVIKTVVYKAWTDRKTHTGRHIDRKVKTEGSKIL